VLGMLAHDLTNQLVGLNMSAGVLCRQITRFQDERVTQLAENCFRTSGQSLMFLKDFLANSKTDHGFTLESRAVNLADFAAAAIAQYQEVAAQKQIRIQTDFPAAAVTALADASALDQVLDNLISNALKFSARNKQVFITIRSAGHRAECVIRDEGPGFTAEDKVKMFRRYGRLSARPTGGEPSTGLGLSIVRKLVQAMDGELSCESIPEKGATFIFRLPLAMTTP